MTALITEDEARTLTAARELLDVIGERLESTDWAARTDNSYLLPYTYISAGRGVHVCQAAVRSIFDVLCYLSSYQRDPVADAWVHGDPAKKEEVPA